MRALLISVVLLLASHVVFAQSVPPNAIVAFNEGKRLLKAGRTDDAIAKLEEAVQLAPGYGEAWTELGNAYLEKQQYVESSGALQRALKVKPEQTVARYNLAFTLRKLGRHREAADQYRLYLQRQPNDADAHYGLAEALRAGGEKLAAAEAYEAYAAAERNPAQQKWVEKAKETAAQLRSEATVQTPKVAPEKDAVAAKPKPEAKPKESQGSLHLSFSNRSPEAPAEQEIATETERKEPASLTADAPKQSARPESFRAGLTHLQNRDFRSALPRLEAADREMPDDPLILAAIGSAHLGLEDGEKAEAMYQRALQKAADEALPGLYLGLGEARRLLGKNGLALEAYQRALRHERATNSIKRFSQERIAALE